MSNAEQKEQKRDLEKTLANSLYSLLEEHPLYDSRKNEKLRVLLVGSGECLDLLRDKLLANGQLLNTELEMVVYSESAAADGEHLMEAAPDLRRFIRLGGVLTAEAPEWDLGSLSYQQGELTQTAVAGLGNDFGYILVSTGQTRLNKTLAAAVDPAEGCTVAYVRDVVGAERLNALTEKRGKERKSASLRKKRGLIEPVAYNLHHAYERGNDPLATDGYIRKTYLESYNRESNIECALHLQGKLRSIGIRMDDPKLAARTFQDRLGRDPDGKMVEDLARLEHQRWCISKVLQGFRRPPDVEGIYSSYKVGTHNKKEHWHIALAPYGDCRKYRSGLCEDDWIAADPELIPELDELDRQTLRVHKKCGELSRDIFRFCDETVNGLRALTDGTLSGELDELWKKLEALDQRCSRLYRNTPVFDSLLYRDCDDFMGGLREKLPEGSEAQKLLDQIICRLGAWHEFITRKDYKEQCRIQIRNIPFALSQWRDMTLVKLMSDDVDECINSVWQLSPTKVIFLDYVNSEEEMASITLRMRRIHLFLMLHGKDVEAEFHFYLSGAAKVYTAKYLRSVTECECRAYKVDSAKADVIRPQFVSMLGQCQPDYIDLTGGKPELIGMAEEYSRNSSVGAFVIRDNRIRAYENADGLDGLALDKTMTVEQMFHNTGARKVKEEERVSIHMKNGIKAFWEVACDNSADWHTFCFRYFSPAYRKMEEAMKKVTWDRSSVSNHCFELIEKGMDQSRIQRFRDIREQLVKAQVLAKNGETYSVPAPDILLALRNSGKVLEYYIYCTAIRRFTEQNVAMSWQFAHSWGEEAAQNEVDVICTRDTGSLFISAKFVSMDTIRSNGFVNHVCYEICEVADHFGLNAKKVLAAPNVPQYDPDHPTELSRYVKHAKSRGVYLLGDACFRGDRLGQVLENIAADKENWYEVEEKAPAGV